MLAVEEQETVINFSRQDKDMSVYTSDKTMMTKLDKKVKNYPDTWSVVEIMKDRNGEIVGKRYTALKKLCSLRNEQNKQGEKTAGNPNAAEALKKWRESQKQKTD